MGVPKQDTNWTFWGKGEETTSNPEPRIGARRQTERLNMNKELLMARLLTATPSELKKIEAVFTGEGLTEPTDRRLLTIQQVADTLGVSRTTVWRMLRDGALPCVELRPGSRRIPSQAVTEFARRGAAQ